LAGSNIAVDRRRHENGAHAGDRGRRPGDEIIREPDFHDAIRNLLKAALAHSPDSLVPRGFAGKVAGRICENELADALRGLSSEPLPNHTAHRQPAPMDALQAEGVHDGEGVAAESFDGAAAGDEI